MAGSSSFLVALMVASALAVVPQVKAKRLSSSSCSPCKPSTCAFKFKGPVSTFTIPKMPASGDQPFTTDIVAPSSPPSITLTTISSTGTASLSFPVAGKCSAKDQFYVGGGLKVVYRTFQAAAPASAYGGVCVTLPITGAQFLNTTSGQTFNLNDNKLYPSSSRCVVFTVSVV